MTPNKHNKRPLAAVAHDDNAAKLSTTNNSSNSFRSFTLPSSKKPRLATSWDKSNSPQKMGYCASGESEPLRMRSEPDVNHSDRELCGGSAASLSSSTTPLLPYRSALLPTPEPEGAMGGCDPRPLLFFSNDPGLTPPPTIPSPGTSSVAKHVTQERRNTTPTEPAGGRFWETLHTDGMEGYLERFFMDVFEVSPAMGRNDFSNRVSPFYRQGIMAGYIRTGENFVVKEDNVGINIAAMQVSKEFQETGSRLIYGRHKFYFSDPINCKWWCKHIGELNLANIRTLIIEMNCGWTNVRTLHELCSLDQSDEELWHSFFSWFRSRHQLHTMCINFDNWKDVQKIAPWDTELQNQLHHWRKKIGDILLGYRGLKRAVIRDSYGLGLERELGDYSLMMIQNRASVFPPAPKQKMSLAQLLAQRHDASQHAAWIQYDKRQEKKQRSKEQKEHQRQTEYPSEQQEHEAEDKDTEMGGFAV